MSGQAVLMERAGERMNVPPDKIQAYLNDGWKVIGQPTAPEADAPVQPSEESFLEVVKKKPGKRPAKK